MNANSEKRKCCSVYNDKTYFIYRDIDTLEMLYRSCGVGGKPMLSNTYGLESWGRLANRMMKPDRARMKINSRSLFLSFYEDGFVLVIVSEFMFVVYDDVRGCY